MTVQNGPMTRNRAPKALQRAQRWWIPVTLLAIAIYPLIRHFVPHWNGLVAVATAGVASCVVIVETVQTRRWRRRLMDLDYEACLNCAYPLKGLPSKHMCPECGAPYSLNHVKAMWVACLYPKEPQRKPRKKRNRWRRMLWP